MKKAHLKAIVSTLLILSFLFLAFSGALLHFGKTGVVLGMPRGALRTTHFYVAVFACVLIIIHLTLNCGVYLKELRSLWKRKR